MSPSALPRAYFVVACPRASCSLSSVVINDTYRPYATALSKPLNTCAVDNGSLCTQKQPEQTLHAALQPFAVIEEVIQYYRHLQ